MKRTIVLASSSPARRALLKRLDIPFKSISPDIDESLQQGETARITAKRLAYEKALAVLPKATDAIIIASDQVAVVDETILNKPISQKRALEQLMMSNGKWVSFHTGLCVYDTKINEYKIAVEVYRVQFRNLTESQYLSYLRKEKPYQCAGSFKSEGLGISLFECCEGNDPNSLVGLPLIRLVSLLKHFGVEVI